MGTMGYSIPAAVGAKHAPGEEVVVVCGDGAFKDEQTSWEPIAQNHLNVKIIIMRNTRLGMVRELQKNLYGSRYSATLGVSCPGFV